MYRMYGSRTMQDAIVEDKSGLSQISSSFKEHVILFDEKELKVWPNPAFSQYACMDASGRVESGTETETNLSPTDSWSPAPEAGFA